MLNSYITDTINEPEVLTVDRLYQLTLEDDHLLITPVCNVIPKLFSDTVTFSQENALPKLNYIRSAVNATTRSFSILQQMNSRLAGYFTVMVPSRKRQLSDVLHKFKLKQITEEQQTNIRSIHFIGYSYSDFSNKLLVTEQLCDVLTKTCVDKSILQLPNLFQQLGYTQDNNSQIVKDSSLQYSDYEFFKQQSIDDLITLTEQYLKICDRSIMFRSIPEYTQSQISGSIKQVASINTLASKNRPDVKEQIKFLATEINNTLNLSTYVTNGAIVVKSQIELMGTMLSDIWENIMSVIK